VPVQCDHENDQDVFNLFERIKSEQNGRLDILVNNAYKAVTVRMKKKDKIALFKAKLIIIQPFFDSSLSLKTAMSSSGSRTRKSGTR
jgi:NAD(P)-dependent dehydrogenase (short-subunit alcohol dehydrogenase family)